MKRPHDRFTRILVICTRQIGDVLLTTPLIAAAKARWPEAAIDVLGFGGTLGMLRGNPAVRELIEVPAGSGWIASRKLIARLWRRYDLALIAQYSDRAHLYGFVAARTRSGQLPGGVPSWWKRLLLTHAVLLDNTQSHAVVEKLRLLEPWVEAPDARLVPPPGSALPDDMAAALRVPYAVLQVPVAVAYKAWPVAHWVDLITDLVARGLQVVLTGAPSAADRAQVDAVLAHLGGASPRVLDAAGRLDLNQLTTLLDAAAFYVGGDTSITHLATACRTPVIALYGPIDPRLFGPWPASAGAAVPYERHALVQRAGAVTLLQGTPPCVPCNKAGCDDHNGSHSVCLQTMLPARVIAEVERVLVGAKPMSWVAAERLVPMTVDRLQESTAKPLENRSMDLSNLPAAIATPESAVAPAPCDARGSSPHHASPPAATMTAAGVGSETPPQPEP